MTKLIKLFIDGQWVEGSDNQTIPVINPATEETISEVCVASKEDLQWALDAAQRGFMLWRDTPAESRAGIIHKTAELMRQRVDELTRVITLEQGKPLGQSKFEILATANYFDDLAERGMQVAAKHLPQEASGISRRIKYEPIGPIYAVSPWNLPAMMPGRKIANALAAGCSLIVKPAEETPETAFLIAKCCQDAGLPDGVLNMVCGNPSLISETLISSPIIRKVSFTGSTPVGKLLAEMAGRNMKKITLELGGHAPVIICDDVDIGQVVKMTVPARYANAGQSCIAATRFFVQQSIYDNFVESFTDAVKNLKLGNGIEEATDIGPLMTHKRLSAMEDLITDAQSKGAKLLCGGKRLEGKGYFFEATVLAGVPQDAKIMSEEPFGPITPISAFTELEEAIQLANNTAYGLASYIFAKNPETSNRIANDLEAGLVGINSMFVAGPPVPFGGVKDSGFGREGAMEGILECMVTKTVSIGA